MVFKGRCWKFGDDIDTDQMIPADSLKNPLMMVENCFKNIEPAFSEEVQPGDIIVAGENFGCGSSRPGALPLKMACVSAVIAASYDRIFYRNTVNIGLYPITCPELAANTEKGDIIELDIDQSVARNLTKGGEYIFEPLPGLLRKIIESGGYLSFLAAEIKVDGASSS